MKINFACGRRVLDGWFNIDAVRSPRAPRDPELLHAVTFHADGSVASPVPLPDACADELMAMHIVEHVYAWEAPGLVAEWRRLLKPGGLLVVECPDIVKAARNLLAGMSDQMAMWPLYGDPGHRDVYMTHRWGYTPKTLAALLAGAGFTDIRHLPPQRNGGLNERDMRMEARKP